MKTICRGKIVFFIFRGVRSKPIFLFLLFYLLITLLYLNEYHLMLNLTCGINEQLWCVNIRYFMRIIYVCYMQGVHNMQKSVFFLQKSVFFILVCKSFAKLMKICKNLFFQAFSKFYPAKVCFKIFQCCVQMSFFQMYFSNSFWELTTYKNFLPAACSVLPFT